MEGTLAAIKKIVDVYVDEDGLKYFRIAWKDTWESELHLISCQEAIDAFWKLQSANEETEKEEVKKECQKPWNNFGTDQNTRTIQCSSINTTSTPQLACQKSEASQSKGSDFSNVCTSCGREDKNDGYKTIKYKESGIQCMLLKNTTNDPSTQSEPEIIQTVDKSSQINTCVTDYQTSSAATDNNTETCDVECQHEYHSRDFAVQYQPQLTDIGLHIRPQICSRSIQVNVDQMNSKLKKGKSTCNAMTQYEKKVHVDIFTQIYDEEVFSREHGTQCSTLLDDACTQYEVYSRNQSCQCGVDISGIGIQCNLDRSLPGGDEGYVDERKTSEIAKLVETKNAEQVTSKHLHRIVIGHEFEDSDRKNISNGSSEPVNSSCFQNSKFTNIQVNVNSNFLVRDEAVSPDTTTMHSENIYMDQNAQNETRKSHTLVTQSVAASQSIHHTNMVYRATSSILPNSPYPYGNITSASIPRTATVTAMNTTPLMSVYDVDNNNIMPHSQEIQNLLKGHFLHNHLNVDEKKFKEMYFVTENPLQAIGNHGNTQAKGAKRGREKNSIDTGTQKRKKIIKSEIHDEIIQQSVTPRPLFFGHSLETGRSSPLQSLVELSKNAGSSGHLAISNKMFVQTLVPDSSSAVLNTSDRTPLRVSYLNNEPRYEIIQQQDNTSVIENLKCTSPLVVYSNSNSPIDSQGPICYVTLPTADGQQNEQQYENILNDSHTSTVYDPKSPSLASCIPTCDANENNSPPIELLPSKELVSLRVEEKKINEDFISKYWK